MPNIIKCESRAHWLARRRSGIGASDSAAILGEDPYRSAIAVYMDKVSDIPGREEKWEFTRGHAMEPAIAEFVSQELGTELIDLGQYTIVLAGDPLYCTPDRLIGDPWKTNVQIKTAGKFSDQWRDNEVPMHVQIQVQHEMHVAEVDNSIVAVSIAGEKPVCYDVLRNDRFIVALLVKLEEFWDRVLNKNPPDPDASESARETIAKLYCKPTGSSVFFPAEYFTEADGRLQEVKAEKKVLDKEQKGIENRIKAQIANNSVGVLDSKDYEYTLESQTREEYTVKSSTYRVLRRRKHRG